MEPREVPAFQGKGQDGMSLRDWFDGQALASIAAAGFSNSSFESERKKESENLARAAYEIANAMLEQRDWLEE